MAGETTGKTNDFSNKEGSIWMDGEWVEWKDAKTHVLTNTLHYGLGVYEGARVYTNDNGDNPAVFRLEDHISRLYDSARLANITVPQEKASLISTCVQVLEKNKLTSAYIRPMVFLGSEGMGLHAKNLKPHIMVAAWEWGAYLGNTALTEGIRVKTSTYRRNHIDSLHAKAKINGHYVNSMMALREAESLGFNEALMLDHLGFIAEGSGENFFMIKNGKILTPLPYAILSGITRDTIFALSRDLNIPIEETNITRDAVYLADEAFFTGTAAEVTPVCQLDAYKIGSGKPGPITQKLQEAYFDVVKGRNPKYNHWLTPTHVSKTQTPVSSSALGQSLSKPNNVQSRSFHTQRPPIQQAGLFATRAIQGSKGAAKLAVTAGVSCLAGGAALFALANSANRAATKTENVDNQKHSVVKIR